MPKEEEKTKTQLGKEKRLAEKAARKAASDARRAKTAKIQAAVDDRVNNGTQRQRATAKGMDKREREAGLNLRGNDPMAGRRTPAQQVGTQGNGINFTSTQMNAFGGGGSGGSHAFKMSFFLDDNDNPVVSFDQRDTDVYIRGTNDYYAPDASLQDGVNPTGKPSNIDGEIALTSGATNYIYLEASYDDSASTEPDDFEIVVYTAEETLVVSETDGGVTPNELYQSVGAVLIGTIELDSSGDLTGSGVTQQTNTRLFAELFYISSITAYLMVP